MLTIVRFIPTRSGNGTIFHVVSDQNNLKVDNEIYKAVIVGNTQYFKVLSVDSRAYRLIVGDMTTDKPLLVENYGYYGSLLGIDRCCLAIGADLKRVTDKAELARVNTEACWM